MTVLALDLATQCGYAILRADGRIESGSERFAACGKEGAGMRWVHFRHWLVDQRAQHEFTKVAYELVVGGGPSQIYAQQVYGGFVAVLQTFCEHHRIQYQGHHVGTIKKAWTGIGNAPKFEMIARAKHLGFNPKDDNEADAIALLHLATDRVPKLPIGRLTSKPKPRTKPDKATRPLAIDPF